MNEIRKKKIDIVTLNVTDHDVSLFIENNQVYITADGSLPKSLDKLSDLLLCLIRNHNKPVERPVLRKLVPEEIEDKTFLNYFDKLKSILNHFGPEYITTGGRGQKYWAMFSIDESCIIYSEGEYETKDDFFQHAARTEGYFPPVSQLTGGKAIKKEYLPTCQLGQTRYPSLEALVSLSFLQDPIHSSLIVSAVGGSGKTFSLCDIYEKSVSRGVRAVYVPVADLQEEEHNLIHYIARKNLCVQDYHDHISAMEAFMENSSGPILLLVDGMNEKSAATQKYCCLSFSWLAQQYPDRIHGIFTTRFPQVLKSSLYQPLEAQLLPLPALRFKNRNLEFLEKLHIELTPLIIEQLESMSAEDLTGIHSRYDLYTRYFDTLADRADRKDSSGWTYDVLAAIAAASMEGQTISSRWLKRFCSENAEDDFIHSYCAGEEYPLENADTVEKLKATGFLLRGDLDRYTIHQQYRDYLTVRHALLLIRHGQLSAAEFLRKIADATRYYTVSGDEDAATVNLRRHNNMDLGEFGFCAGLGYYRAHPEDSEVVPVLVQLGIQVAYLYDNVQNHHGLYALYGHLHELLAECFSERLVDQRMYVSLPGYYFCLNKLVTPGSGIEDLSDAGSLLAFSETLERYYESWLPMSAAADSIHSNADFNSTADAGSDSELRAIALSGLGGVYLARYRIVDSFDEKNSCLSHAIKYHTEAMELRRVCSSPKLYLSYAALGTDYFYKGRNYLNDPGADRHAEARNVFRSAAEQHKLAVEQETNQEKYVSYTRMAGCWYQLHQLARNDDEKKEAREELFSAVAASYNALQASAARSGVTRHSSEIAALLRDISRYMGVLPFADADFRFIDHLCELHHQAFSGQRKPQRNEDNTRIVF